MRRECRERFPPPPISKETASKRSRHASRHVRDARAVMHVGIACLRWRGKRSRHSRRMRIRKFAYLARGPWFVLTTFILANKIIENKHIIMQCASNFPSSHKSHNASNMFFIYLLQNGAFLVYRTRALWVSNIQLTSRSCFPGEEQFTFCRKWKLKKNQLSVMSSYLRSSYRYAPISYGVKHLG